MKTLNPNHERYPFHASSIGSIIAHAPSLDEAEKRVCYYLLITGVTQETAASTMQAMKNKEIPVSPAKMELGEMEAASMETHLKAIYQPALDRMLNSELTGTVLIDAFNRMLGVVNKEGGRFAILNIQYAQEDAMFKANELLPMITLTLMPPKEAAEWVRSLESR
jgi:hypothetical protein